jgi:hypothetical protein
LQLSVVIPCFNYEAFVSEAIESLLAGTRRPDEMIVVDDGSSDGSAAVARRFAEVTLIEKPNGGMASALNAGFAAATGDVVVLLDADDIAEPRRLEWIERAFADPTVCMAWHPLRIVSSGGKPSAFCVPHRPLPSGDLGATIALRGLTSFAMTSGIAVRRSALERIGPIPEDRFRLSSEGYLVRTLPFGGRIAATDEPLGRYRAHPGSQIRALPSFDVLAVAKKLQQHLDIADVEHVLLSSSAKTAGFTVPVERLRGMDPTYLDYHRWHARLAAPSRRAFWSAFGSLVVEFPIRLAHRRIIRFLAGCWTMLLPKRAARVSYLIRHDHGLTGLTRQYARIYWLHRAARSALRDRLRRRSHRRR